MRKHKHIGSYGLIIKDDMIVLIKKKRGPYTGKLDLPGGGIEHGETSFECLIREIKEETDLEVVDFKLLDVFSFNLQWKMKDFEEDLHHLGIVYEVKTIGIPSSKGDGRDSLGAYYFKINDLKRENLSPFTIMGLEKLGYKL